MDLALSKNLNNLNHFWQALNTDESNDFYTHKSWPNKHWQAGFNLPDNISSATLPKNKVISTIVDLSNQKISGLVVKNQLMVMNLALDQGVNSSIGKTHSKIVKLSGEENAIKWSQGCGQAFGYEIDTRVIQDLLKNSNASVFAYLIDGEIAGTAISYKTGDTLGIHQLGTVPSFRKMGVALALMEHILAQAVSQNCHFVSLQASQAGLYMYEKLGFQSLGKLTSLVAAK